MLDYSNFFAESLFNGEILGPIIVGLGFMAIPVIAILTKHQRQMAEIIHGRRHEDVLRCELDDVKNEVSQLRMQLRTLNTPSTVDADSEALTRRLG